MGFVDIDDEKDNIPDLERDKEIYQEKLRRAVMTKEIGEEMIRDAESAMRITKSNLDRIEHKIRIMNNKKVRKKVS